MTISLDELSGRILQFQAEHHHSGGALRGTELVCDAYMAVNYPHARETDLEYLSYTFRDISLPLFGELESGEYAGTKFGVACMTSAARAQPPRLDSTSPLARILRYGRCQGGEITTRCPDSRQLHS